MVFVLGAHSSTRPFARALGTGPTRAQHVLGNTYRLTYRPPGYRLRLMGETQRVFPITIRRTFGAMPEIHRVTWAPGPELSVVDLYETHRSLPLKSSTRPDEKPADLPLVSFGAYDQADRKGPGCRESNLNPEGVHVLALDYDDLTPQDMLRVLSAAKSFSPEGLAHTTWNHGLKGDKVRARVVMPLDGPVPACAWGTFWQYANDALCGLADPQCKNIGRFWYLPCVNLDAPAWVLGTDGGCWLDVWGQG